MENESINQAMEFEEEASASENKIPLTSRRILFAVLYGSIVGMGIISYLARSGWIKFERFDNKGITMTVIDVLLYPKQQDVFWYLLALALPLTTGLLYGWIERRFGILYEGAWLICLFISVATSPLLAIMAWPGAPVAALHILLLSILPAAAGRRLRRPEGGTRPPPRSSYRPSRWLSPLLLLIFAGFNTHGYMTSKGRYISHMLAGTIIWSVLIALLYLVFFALVMFLFGKPVAETDPEQRANAFWNRINWGMLPVVILPFYNLVWGQRKIYLLMVIFAALLGAVLFIREPKRDAGIATMFLLPLGIAMMMHISPFHRFAPFDAVHEGQQLAFAQCVYRGMLPGVEKTVKYGPLYELSTGWTFLLFEPKISVLRMYFQWMQVLGYWFGCLMLMSVIRRRWILVYGWVGYIAFSIAALYSPGRFNGMRVGLPMLAIYLWSRRCRGGGIGWLLGAGAVGAMGAVYSVEFGMAGTLALICGLATRGLGKGFSKGIRLLMRETVGLVAGALIIALPFTVMYALRGGVISLITGLYEYAAAFNLGYGAFPFPHFPWLDDEAFSFLGFPYIFNRLKFYMGPFVLLACGSWLLGRYLSGRWSSELAGVVALWIYSIVAFRSAMGRSDIYHLIQAVAPSIVILFFLADRLVSVFRSELKRDVASSPLSWALPGLLAMILLLLPLLNSNCIVGTITRFASHHTHKNYKQIEKRYRKAGMRTLNIERANNIWMNSKMAKKIEQATNFIVKNTKRDEPVHIISLLGVYFFFSDRIPLSRYTQTGDAIMPGNRRELLELLKTEKPELILGNLNFGTNFPYFIEHPEEVAYIRKHYEFTHSVGGLQVFVRKKDNDGRQ